MKNLFLLLAISIFALFISCSTPTKEDSYGLEGEIHLKNITMLTDDGENAEAYLSFDESKLSFQATFGELECDQIFTMNIDGTDKKMVSTGKGRTTCAYYLPGDDRIIYSSTHMADANCPPPPDRSKGYVWQLYDSFDIFTVKTDGTDLVRLTDSGNYDAEATVSPNGDKIVFTSMRDGDPEIYVMDIDGSNQTRLTFEKGYDGGPFFSADGSKIIFRSSRPKTEEELADYNELVEFGLVRPSTLEIYIMNADGSNMKQITNFGKASFAPFLHPSGDKIIFASNVNSTTGRNFDIYTVNIDGTGLEQITFNETFDGFPIFSRDGKKLIFCSNRFNKKEGDTNVFTADWID
jgi:Tol biopolymer transport system component